MLRVVSSGIVLLLASLQAQSQTSFRNFESSPTHALRLSPDGSRLFAAHTADNRVVVWSVVDPDRPVLIAEIPVGLDPVSVNPRSNDEVWVVNQLSDSVSIVSVSAGRVIDTLRVKDEPVDIAFAGQRAFVTAMASDEVRVFDIATRAAVGSVPIFGKDPCALAVNAAGTSVYAVVRRSGNKTTLIRPQFAGPPPAPTTPGLPAAPQQGIIVLSTNPSYASQIPYTLPDNDVVEINAATLAVTRTFTGVGTTNTDIAVHPATGDLWVTNIDSRNLVRFEPVLRGHAIDSRITRISTGGIGVSVVPFDLNPGINYSTMPNPAALATALAEPYAVVFDPAQNVFHVAAQGSDRLAAVSPLGTVTGFIEIGSTPGTTVNTIDKRGPRALALHAAAPRLYVLNHLSATISIVDTVARTVVSEFRLGSHDPMPAAMRNGRKFLYDTKLSGNGTMSCASCHIDGDNDGLVWDLGDPGGTMQAPPVQPSPFSIGVASFHPMKGPMVTQTLKGLDATSPLHWRGDKADFQAFNGAFQTLLGGSLLSTADMNLYAGFATAINYPPNPNQPLSRSYQTTPASANQQAGFNAFVTPTAAIPNLGLVACSTCHALPAGTSRMVISTTVTAFLQPLKVPQLRNAYRKAGFMRAAGPQKAGFGYSHDGSFDTIAAFLQLGNFNQWPSLLKDDLEQFVLAFDTGTAPTVGYQAMLTAANAGQPAAAADLALLTGRAQAGDIDLVAKGVINGEARGLVYVPGTQTFVTDRAAEAPWTLAALTQSASAGTLSLTFTGVPPGSGTRIGVDRDLDGVFDGDEGVALFGTGTAGCAGMPRLFANSEPRAGNSVFALLGAQAPPSAQGLFILGVAPASLPWLGITVLVDPFLGPPFFAPVSSDAAGWLYAPIPIPSIPSLVGATAYAQVSWLDACAPMGLAATRGLRLTVQP